MSSELIVSFVEIAFDGGVLNGAVSGDPVALQASMKGGARQMRNSGLQGVKAVVERQQSMPSESDDHSLFLEGENR
jgi:hypothetical protein